MSPVRETISSIILSSQNDWTLVIFYNFNIHNNKSMPKNNKRQNTKIIQFIINFEKIFKFFCLFL